MQPGQRQTSRSLGRSPLLLPDSQLTALLASCGQRNPISLHADMPEHQHAKDGPSGQHAHSHPHKDSSMTTNYNYRFVHDPKVHNGFKHARRHVLKNADAAKGGHHSTGLHNTHKLSKEDEKLLRLGLSKIDMDHRCEGTLSDSQANKAANEVVVRLYRTWTSHLVYEARYRPVGSDHKLMLYEFAWEGDKKTYNGSDDLYTEIAEYIQILQGPILKVIKDKLEEK